MHIFISYARKDTRQLALELDAEFDKMPDITCWVDQQIGGGDNWVASIERQILRADLMIVLISPDVNRDDSDTGRSFVHKEINFAQSANIPILPVLAQSTRIPITLADLQYIDLTKNSVSNKRKLLDKVKDFTKEKYVSPQRNEPLTNITNQSSKSSMKTKSVDSSIYPSRDSKLHNTQLETQITTSWLERLIFGSLFGSSIWWIMLNGGGLLFGPQDETEIPFFSISSIFAIVVGLISIFQYKNGVLWKYGVGFFIGLGIYLVIALLVLLLDISNFETSSYFTATAFLSCLPSVIMPINFLLFGRDMF